MSRVLTLSAILAWVLIQVPLVFCSTACGQSVRSLLMAAGHACHDEASVAHHSRCTHGTRGTGTDHPLEEDTDEEQGEHTVVVIQSPSCGCSVDLPDHDFHVAPWACAGDSRDDLLVEPNADGVFRSLDPPRCADPVTASVLLQV